MRGAIKSPLLGNPISMVVAADVHALLGRFPKARYPVGIDSKVCYLIEYSVEIRYNDMQN